MGYIAISIVVIGFFFAIERFTQMNVKKRVITSAIVLAVLLSLYQFEAYNDATREHKNNLVYAFEHNATLRCGDQNVSSIAFNYSPNGHSFIGKAQSRYDGLIISVYECKIVP